MSKTPERKVNSDSSGRKASKLARQFSPEELASIREALLTRRSSLLQQQENQLNALNSPEKHHIADLEEMGGDGSDTDSLCALVDLNSSNIDQIDSALENLRAGNYGICAVCKESIAPARLEFLPFASLCVDCQRQQETQEEVADTSTS